MGQTPKKESTMIPSRASKDFNTSQGALAYMEALRIKFPARTYELARGNGRAGKFYVVYTSDAGDSESEQGRTFVTICPTEKE
jgi:hypothetical protein